VQKKEIPVNVVNLKMVVRKCARRKTYSLLSFEQKGSRLFLSFYPYFVPDNFLASFALAEKIF